MTTEGGGGKCVRGHGILTSTFKAINMWQWLFSSNSLILKLSRKGPGIIKHYYKTVFYSPDHMGLHVGPTTSKEDEVILRDRGRKGKEEPPA